MKEFFALLRKGKFKAIFFLPTENGFLQLFRYLFVGGIATVADWGVVFGAELLLRQILPVEDYAKYAAVALGFAVGLLVNFLLSRAFVFQTRASRLRTPAGEFAGHATVGLIGLGMTEGLVWLGDLIGLYFMISKVIATIVVLVWNYLARKFFVYGGKKKEEEEE